MKDQAFDANSGQISSGDLLLLSGVCIIIVVGIPITTSSANILYLGDYI
jgi:hypothetical protein